jgi:predicted MFS family arabinose efflux permease
MAPDLNTTTSAIGLLVTGYALVVLVATVPLAHVTRNIPRRWVLAATIGLVVIGTVWGGAAHSYGSLLAARLVTALAHALFWVAVLPGTTGLFPPRVRGRVTARLAIGNSLAPLLGIPAGTWLGEHTSWRVTFWVAAGLSVVIFALVVFLFPTMKPSASGAAKAPFPDRKRFSFQLVATALIVTGAFGLLVFVTELLRDLAGFSLSMIPGLLLIQGVAGLLGALVIARFLDRFAWESLVVALLLVLVALVVLAAFGQHGWVAVAAIALFGFAFTAIPPTFSHRVMQNAPTSADMGIATSSAIFNLGIAGGSGLGALLVATVGVRMVPLMGAVLIVLGLLAVLAERRFCAPLPTRRHDIDAVFPAASSN